MKTKFLLLGLSLFVVSCGGMTIPLKAQSENPLSASNYATPIAKQLAESLDNQKKLKQLVIKFVDSSRANLSCKLSVFPFHEMVPQLQEGIKSAELSMKNVREKLRSKGISTDSIEDDSAASVNLAVKLTRDALKRIDNYCASAQ